MMYSNKLAAAIKVAGKVLREHGDTVYLPFGSEYSILIKNLNTVRVKVTVYVDGVDLGDNQQFTIPANDSIEIERFIKNGNMSSGNKLKFIERTVSIEDHRGIAIEDGLIRIEYNFEKEQVVKDVIEQIWYIPDYRWYDYYRLTDPCIHPRWDPIPVTYMSSTTNSVETSSAQNSDTSANVSMSSVLRSATKVNDAGITVPGSQSSQKFKKSEYFPVQQQTHSIVLKLLGVTEDNKQVTEAISVKHKPKCSTCGKRNKATAKFCVECGTSLNIL